MIGVDFDNTLVSYDRLLYRLARERNLIAENTPGQKKAIRDAIRHLDGGEAEWQKLQARAYGLRIREAELMEGVREFFVACRITRRPIAIVSHKGLRPSRPEFGVDLRAAALDWMQDNEFFDPRGMALKSSDVYFEASREAKIQRIASLQCAVFIDDLEETFGHPTFPASVERILFSSQRPQDPALRNMSTWHEISEYLFGGSDRTPMR